MMVLPCTAVVNETLGRCLWCRHLGLSIICSKQFASAEQRLIARWVNIEPKTQSDKVEEEENLGFLREQKLSKTVQEGGNIPRT